MIAEPMTEQVYQRADQAMADLEQQLASVAQCIQDTHVELADIRQARDIRAQRQRQAQATLSQSENNYTQAVVYAKMAQDTLGEQEAIKRVSSAKKEIQIARKALERIERESVEVEQIERTREQELGSRLAEQQAEQRRLDGELQTTQEVYRQAHQTLGEAKHTAIIAAYSERQARIDELKSQLVEAQVELHDFHEAALAELAGWEDLQKDVARLKQEKDSTTTLIEAALLYAQTIHREGKRLRTGFPRPSVRSGISVWDILVIPADEIVGNHKQLQVRINVLEHLLADYHAYLAKIGQP